MRKSIRERFAEMTRLYHFTSFEAACKIIESKKLRFGKLSQMNDLVESNKMVFQHVVLGDIEKDENNGLYAEQEMRRYQQISFSQDRIVDDRTYEGFNLHPMWGLYADRGYGACLVFDKNKLKYADGDYARSVEYWDLVLPDFGFRNKSKKGLKAKSGEGETKSFLGKGKNGKTSRNFE